MLCISRGGGGGGEGGGGGWGFFFQAEDGIRDIGVTGVQTCALPILIDFYFTSKLRFTLRFKT